MITLHYWAENTMRAGQILSTADWNVNPESGDIRTITFQDLAEMKEWIESVKQKKYEASNRFNYKLAKAVQDYAEWMGWLVIEPNELLNESL